MELKKKTQYILGNDDENDDWLLSRNENGMTYLK